MSNLVFLLFLAVFVPSVQADELSDTANFLEAFDQAPSTFLAPSIPEFEVERAAVRARIMGAEPMHIFSIPLGNDRAESLADNGAALRSLTDMHARRLTQAKLAEQPWSDDYWAIAKGILGARYAEPGYPRGADWQENQNWVLANSSSVENLSPSEKYDLLMGDAEQTLTKRMWAEGRGYFEREGKVEGWMGICHGWAGAAFMLPRAQKAVNVLAADGLTRVPFFPADIKALASLLWANTRNNTRFVGGRCNTKAPGTDGSGRVKDDSCRDTNPATWHLSVVNQLGVSKRALVIDATYDYEVWNQPVDGYRYWYFNPETRKGTYDLNAAVIKLKNYKHDKFGKFRSKDAKYVIGIGMDVTYVVETAPTQAVLNGPDNDAHRTVRYFYDLELDSKGNILGGEWYSSLHPDFVWTPVKGTRALSVGDDDVRALLWDPVSAAVPAEFTPAARQASSLGQPLAKVVETLIELSRRK